MFADQKGQRFRHIVHLVDVSVRRGRVRKAAPIEPGQDVEMSVPKRVMFPVRGKVVWVSGIEPNHESEMGVECSCYVPTHCWSEMGSQVA